MSPTYCHWLAFREAQRQGGYVRAGNDGQEDVAGQRQLERRMGLTVAVPAFLPDTGVALVMVAGCH